MATKIQIANGFYESRSLPLSNQECVNFYVHTPQTQGTLSDRVLFGTPGLEEVVETSNPRDANRGSFEMGGIAYFVNGTKLYSVDSEYTRTEIGTISGDGRVSMASNGTQLMILVPDDSLSLGYIYSVAGGLAAISDGDFTASGNPQMVVFIDSYFACVTDEDKWIISDPNDGTSWDALMFSTAESSPDPIVSLAVVKNQIYIIGSTTTEGFQDIGGAGFPFQRSGLFLGTGCVAKFSVISTGDNFFMVGAKKNETPAIWMFNGNNYEKISTPAIDAYINSLDPSTLQDCFALYHAEAGDYFVCFAFSETTFCYNTVNGTWHERKSWVDSVFTRWRVNSIVSIAGVNLVGDVYDGRIGRLSTLIYGEYDNDIISTASAEVLSSSGEQFFISKVTATLESGVGNSVVEEPEISMAVSYNGRTYNKERTRKIGKKGEWNKKISWTGLSLFKRFGYLKFRISDQIKKVIIKIEVE